MNHSPLGTKPLDVEDSGLGIHGPSSPVFDDNIAMRFAWRTEDPGAREKLIAVQGFSKSKWVSKSSTPHESYDHRSLSTKVDTRLKPQI